MKSLKTSQQLLTWVLVHPPDKTVSEKQKRMHIGITAWGVLTSIVAFVSNIVTFMKAKEVPNNMDLLLYIIIQIVTSVAVMNIIIVAYTLRIKITDIFQQVPEIFKNCKFSYHF